MAKRSYKKIITDEVFYRLWRNAGKYDTLKEYINAYTYETLKEYNYLQKRCELDGVQIIELLRAIYEAYNLSYNQIREMAGKENKEIAHIFCISTNTIFEWAKENNRCPDHIRLMMLKQFHLFNLGKYIYLESEVERENDKPKIYKQRQEKTVRKLKGEKEESNITPNNKNDETDWLDLDDEEFDNLLPDTSWLNESIRKWEENHVTKSRDSILTETDYLKDRMRRK